MFDLNEAVRAWRERLASQPDLQGGDLDELEDHLRESLAELRSLGLSAEEAFLIAARRLGDPGEIAGEFAAADPRLRRRLRLRWIGVGALALLVLGLVAQLLAGLAVGGLGVPGPGGAFLARGSGLVVLGVFLTVFLVGGLFIWGVLTGDRTAGRLRGEGLWSRGLWALLGVILVLSFLGAALRSGAAVWLHHGLFLGAGAGMAAALTWFPLALLAVLPVLLVGALWWLARPRGRPR